MGVLDDLGMSRDDLRACIAGVPSRRAAAEQPMKHDDSYIDFDTILREGLTLDEREHDPVVARPRTAGEASSIASFQRRNAMRPDATIRRATALALLGVERKPTPTREPSVPLRAETDPWGPRRATPPAGSTPSPPPTRRSSRRRHTTNELREAFGLPAATTKE